jgi:hypothetical protein
VAGIDDPTVGDTELFQSAHPCLMITSTPTAGQKQHDDGGTMTVEALPSPVIDRRRPRIVSSGELDVESRDDRIEPDTCPLCRPPGSQPLPPADSR